MARPRNLSVPAFVSRFGICAHSAALQAPDLRLPLGPRSSSSERLKQCCISGRVDCGLRRVAAPMGLARIADCTLGAPCHVKMPVRSRASG
eukprot:15482914-Alexandrium_andersonii.AAC.1